MVLKKGPLEITIVSTIANGEIVKMSGFYYIFDDGKVKKIGDIPEYEESYVEWKTKCISAIHKMRVLTMNESDKYKFLPLLLSDEEYREMYSNMKELNKL